MCEFDERSWAERRNEQVLNDALAREVNKGGQVIRRWRLHAVIHRWGWFDRKFRNVSIAPSSKVTSTKWSILKHTSTIVPAKTNYRPCKYCWCHESNDQCQKGELDLFIRPNGIPRMPNPRTGAQLSVEYLGGA